MNTPTASSFRTLPLSEPLLNTLDSLGFSEMTPIQAQTLPLTLEGKDLIAQAKTGSGKTAAFALPLLSHLNQRYFGTQALVLCPTRELADQVSAEIRRLARGMDNIKVLTLCGGGAIKPQIESLSHGAHIVVGTPGRIRDHLERETLILPGLQTLVLDEADRMIDMGFYEDMVAIASHCPHKRHTMLFSATYPDNIRKASARFLKNPTEVFTESLHSSHQIEQHFYEVTEDQRLEAGIRLLSKHQPASTLVFCNTKARVMAMVDLLREQGFNALELHGDMEQRDREDVMIQFANQSCAVLVATDVAARGLDIKTLDAVLNIDISPDPEVHIHRIGRTGRTDQPGLALSLVGPKERHWAERIAEFQKSPLAWKPLAPVMKQAIHPVSAPMVTLCIQGGKKHKLRPGDLLGALTKDAGLQFEDVGKIKILDFVSFVALRREIAEQAYNHLINSQIKGKQFRMRFMS